MTDTVPTVDTDVDPLAPLPQDRTVSRRWLLERAAWVSSAAAAGTLLAPQMAGAADLPLAAVRDPAADTVRPEALADPTELTIAEALNLFDRRRLTPVDLMEAYLDPIETFDPIYQAYNDRTSRNLLVARAAAATSSCGAWASRRRTTTTPTTCSPPPTARSTPGSNPISTPPCVARLKAAGG